MSIDIKKMVDRFLGWKLPRDFSPDCGISFDGRKDDEWNKNKTWPIGTNLLSADQAKAMFEYVLADAALAPKQQAQALPQGWRERLQEMDEASYTYSQHPELAHTIFDSVINALDELESAAPVSAGLSDGEIRFRFFKDMNSEQRLAVFKAFGVYPDDCTERLNHSIESRLLDAILKRGASRLLPPDWVAVKDRLLIDVCYIEGDDPFICGVYGKAPLNTLADIEAQLCQSIEEEDGLLTEEGEYRFTARYEPAQRGDYGRIECEAYWDLTQVSFTPLDEAIEGNSQQAKREEG
jgi:hypothetical protein